MGRIYQSDTQMLRQLPGRGVPDDVSDKRVDSGAKVVTPRVVHVVRTSEGEYSVTLPNGKVAAFIDYRIFLPGGQPVDCLVTVGAKGTAVSAIAPKGSEWRDQNEFDLSLPGDVDHYRLTKGEWNLVQMEAPESKGE